jgi:hypothetical protein
MTLFDDLLSPHSALQDEIDAAALRVLRTKPGRSDANRAVIARYHATQSGRRPLAVLPHMLLDNMIQIAIAASR